MKKIFLLFFITQSAWALPNAAERFSSLLPPGKYDGENCQVKVTQTFRGNVKVSISARNKRAKFTIPKDRFYQYVPEEYYSIYTEEKFQGENANSFLHLSFSNVRPSIYFERSFKNHHKTSRSSIECLLY